MLDNRAALDPHGTRAAIAAIFAPEAVLAEIIRLEATLASVQAELGMIPAEAAAAIRAAAAELDARS